MMRRLFFVLLLLLAWAQGVALAANMRKGPYLMFTGNNAQMAVLWQLDATTTCSIAWGHDVNYTDGIMNSNEYGSDHQHQAVLSGLIPGDHYYYQIMTDTSTYTGDFKAAASGNATNLKFLAYGDTRTQPSVQNTVDGGILNTITADPAYQTIILHVGDWVAGDTEAYWDAEFFTRTQPNIMNMVSRLPVQGARGNHEGTATYYKKYWPYPYVSNCYWAFDYGPAHFVIMDQYDTYGGPSDAQYNWIKSNFQSSTKEWKFLVVHEPAYSAGGGHPNNTRLQTLIEDLRQTVRLDIVFAGHNHYYARAVKDGIQHVTVGSAAAPLATPDPAYPYVVATAQVYHYGKIDIAGSQLAFTAVQPNGTVIDTFTINHMPLPPAPSAPSALMATALGKNSISLNWTDNAFNEEGVAIERSLKSNTGFTRIATVGANTTLWTDTTVTGGKTYYYRICAFNTGGSSAYSNLAQATTPRK